MFGINKNGTKHKVGIIMPAFFPASRVTYDGGTVEDVLDKVAPPPTSSATLIDTLSAGGTANYTPTENGWITMLCSAGGSNKTVNGRIRDANIYQYGICIYSNVNAYTTEPIGALQVVAGRQYALANLSVSTGTLAFYFCK